MNTDKEKPESYYKPGMVNGDIIVKLEEENRKLKEALNEIRFRTYSRDTDYEILDQIKNTLTENGFPYENEED